ncbi:hypothetical protein HDU96_001420 [Phlyctochytrium bullatum]|nr:hypothetical protein HDU96_001420 [Phlyctochytrium bullatum]
MAKQVYVACLTMMMTAVRVGSICLSDSTTPVEQAPDNTNLSGVMVSIRIRWLKNNRDPYTTKGTKSEGVRFLIGPVRKAQNIELCLATQFVLLACDRGLFGPGVTFYDIWNSKDAEGPKRDEKINEQAVFIARKPNARLLDPSKPLQAETITYHLQKWSPLAGLACRVTPYVFRRGAITQAARVLSVQDAKALATHACESLSATFGTYDYGHGDINVTGIMTLESFDPEANKEKAERLKNYFILAAPYLNRRLDYKGVELIQFIDKHMKDCQLTVTYEKELTKILQLLTRYFEFGSERSGIRTVKAHLANKAESAEGSAIDLGFADGLDTTCLQSIHQWFHELSKAVEVWKRERTAENIAAASSIRFLDRFQEDRINTRRCLREQLTTRFNHNWQKKEILMSTSQREEYLKRGQSVSSVISKAAKNPLGVFTQTSGDAPLNLKVANRDRTLIAYEEIDWEKMELEFTIEDAKFAKRMIVTRGDLNSVAATESNEILAMLRSTDEDVDDTLTSAEDAIDIEANDANAGNKSVVIDVDQELAKMREWLEPDHNATDETSDENPDAAKETSDQGLDNTLYENLDENLRDTLRQVFDDTSTTLDNALNDKLEDLTHQITSSGSSLNPHESIAVSTVKPTTIPSTELTVERARELLVYTFTSACAATISLHRCVERIHGSKGRVGRMLSAFTDGAMRSAGATFYCPAKDCRKDKRKREPYSYSMKGGLKKAKTHMETAHPEFIRRVKTDTWFAPLPPLPADSDESEMDDS